ncbi:MAG: fatty acid desaturase [Bdellovibrionales bacterium]|nr:fatty acid desaturase [Bdellovibrionales bacterium]
MKNSWTKFKTNPLYLPTYLGVHTLILVIAYALLLQYSNHDLSLHLTFNHLLLLPVALVFGIQVPTLMHNCVHDNLRSKKLNFIIGELSCFFVLMSLGIIGINHTLHHAHADSHEDPHNPAKKTFLQFFFTSLVTGVEIIGNKYYRFHSKSTRTKILYNSSICMHYAGIFLRLGLWFLLLGPTLFISFFIPAFFFYVFAFAHVNYITHIIDEEGKAQIININSNIYYKLINFIGSGVYYHKNHHLNPRCYNPKYYKVQKRRSLLPIILELQ